MKYKLRRIVKSIYYYCPVFFKTYVSKKIKKKKLKEAHARYRRTKVSQGELANILDKIDISSDVFLHTSIISIGKIEGGTKYVAKSILEKIDLTKYTLLVSALPF